MTTNQKAQKPKKSKKLIFALAFIIIAGVLLSIGNRLWETNKAGYYQVKQAFFIGDLTVRNTPGTYGQYLGDIETYEMAGDIFLSKDENDGGDKVGNQAERVLFPNGYADVNFVGLYQLDLTESIEIALHIRFNNDQSIKYMIKQQIIEALKNTGTLMSAEEAYSFKRADFVRLAWEQSLYGLYKAQVTMDTIINESGKAQEVKRYSVALDEDGKPIITKKSLLAVYGITLPQFNIKDMDFDDKLEGLIEARKDAQKATQDAITAKSRGEALIAKEKAIQEVAKIKEVTIAVKQAEVAKIEAEKKFKVSEYEAKQALEVKKALIAKGEGEARANQLKVSAGLTPQERAEWDYKTSVGVAEAIAKRPVPQFVMGGSSGNGSSSLTNSYTMENMIVLMNQMTKKKKK